MTGAEQTAPEPTVVDEAHPQAAASPPAGPSNAWGAHAATALGHTGRAARTVATTLGERRGLRTVLLAVLIVLVAISLGGAFEVPLLAVGLVMLVIGVMGPRLGGHLGLDFGPEGTAISFQAHIAPPGRRLLPEAGGMTAASLPPRPHIALAPTEQPQRNAVTPGPAAAAPRWDAPATTRSTAERTPATTPERPTPRADIDSTGETMEIDARDLRARLDGEPTTGRAARSG